MVLRLVFLAIALSLAFPTEAAERPPVNLKAIPASKCGVWADNVERLVRSKQPATGLRIWEQQVPRDREVIQVTRRYLKANNALKNETNPRGRANVDCLSNRFLES